MEWKPIWSDCSARWMRPQGMPGLSPNRGTRNYTKTSHLIPSEMKVFWGVKGKLYFLTTEHPKNCFMFPLWWKGPMVSERVFIIWDVACAQNGVSAPDSSLLNIYLRLKFLSIKTNFDLFSGRGKWNVQTFDYFLFFSCLLPLTTFIRAFIVHTEGEFSDTLTKSFRWLLCLCFFYYLGLWYVRCGDKYIDIHLYPWITYTVHLSHYCTFIYWSWTI